MRLLLSLLFVVFVMYMLSNFLRSAGPVSRDQSSRPASGHSEAVRERLDNSTRLYQQKLEKSLEDAGAGQ